MCFLGIQIPAVGFAWPHSWASVQSWGWWSCLPASLLHCKNCLWTNTFHLPDCISQGQELHPKAPWVFWSSTWSLRATTRLLEHLHSLSAQPALSSRLLSRSFNGYHLDSGWHSGLVKETFQWFKVQSPFWSGQFLVFSPPHRIFSHKN